MKSVIFSIVLVLFATSLVNAQDDGLIQTLVSVRKFEEAKKEVEKQLSNPKLKEKDKPVFLLWKIEVLSEIFQNNELYLKYPDADQQIQSALEQYIKMDPTLKIMKEQQFVGGVSNYYIHSFNYAKESFNNKDWANAFKFFSTAEKIGTFLNDNGLTANKIVIDTVTVLYTAYAAQNGNMLNEAAVYYKRLADLKIGGADYEDIYKFLLTYYSETNKDANAFAKYLAIAKEVYPEDMSMWTQYEMSILTLQATLDQIIEKYLEERNANTLNEDKLISYAEVFATPDKEKLDALDSSSKMNLKKLSAEAFGKAFEINNKMGLYAFNTGVVYYGIYSDLDDRYASYRGEGKELVAKRAAVEIDEKAYADTSILWLEKAYNTLKATTERNHSETISLNRCVDYLANLYIWKRDKTRGVDPKNYDVFDAKYKQYDSEHDTFK